jgi:hypothetical protein
MTIFWLYLAAGFAFAVYLAFVEHFPTDIPDAIAYALVMFLAILMWPWFVVTGLYSIWKNDNDMKKDDDIMKMF